MKAIDYEEESAKRGNWLDITGGTSITLLDYFAGKALEGMLAEDGGGALENRELAVVAYAVAEAMLAERNKRFTPQNVVKGVTGKTYG